MGTWCTEGVKKAMAEHYREEADEESELRYRKERAHEEECKEKGVCNKKK